MQRRLDIYLIIVLLTVCCQNSALAIEKKSVLVSILPQKFFIDTIGGDFIKTTVIVNSNHSPADYEPSPSQMMKMSKADIYFAIGVGFESIWLEKFTSINPDLQIIYTDTGIRKKPINRYENLELTFGSETHGHHHHDSMDPHIWLSPPLVKIQAGHILNGLISIDPARRHIYEKNYSQLINQVEILDKELTILFSSKTRHKKFLVFHPSWGYFADAYGLTQISIEIEGKTPKAREVKNLIEFARHHQIELIFVQPQFSKKHAQIIADEINGQIIIADPLAENWYDNIRAVARSIKQALK